MTAKTDLLPCPFCGSTDALRLQNTHTASFWVSCSEDDGGCGAQATGQFFPGPNRRTRFVYNPEAPEGSTFEARTLGELPPEYRRAAKSAIAAWNRRANVAVATAPLQAEIERLRAEVERLRRLVQERDTMLGKRLCSGTNADGKPRCIVLAEERARAERMAEALREWWSAHRPVGWTEDQHRARPYVNLITVADKALTEALLRDQEARND